MIRILRAASRAAVVAAIVTACPGGAAAQPATAPDWAFGSVDGEVVLAAASFGSLASLLVPQRRTAWGPSPARPFDTTADQASDVTGAYVGSALQLGSAWAFEAGYLEAHGVAEPYARALRTSLVDVEAVALTTGLGVLSKRLAGRCRPRDWVEGRSAGRCRPTDAAHEAFPSGHTWPVAAIAATHFVLAARTDGAAGLRWAPVATAELASLGTGALRVLAGAHSWEDVVGAWLLGHAVGAGVALLHPTVAPVSRTRAAPTVGTRIEPLQLRWSGAF